jgi:hypothetical protein
MLRPQSNYLVLDEVRYLRVVLHSFRLTPLITNLHANFHAHHAEMGIHGGESH